MRHFMYVGGFTVVDRGGTGSGGIHVFSSENGLDWTHVQQVDIFNPSFLALSEDQRYLYGIQGNGNTVYAYAIDPNDGTLRCINSLPANKGLACEVHEGYLYVAAEGVQIYRLREDGGIGEKVIDFAPTGEVGPITGVQRAAQPHHILHDPSGACFAVPCRGYDCVHIYRFYPDSGKVEDVSTLRTYPGFYPRHIAFHPRRPLAYLVLERFGMVVSCRFENGVLSPFSMIPTVPDSFTGRYNAASEIMVHPDGKHVCVSNRGTQSLAMFSINEEGGLSPIGWTTEAVSMPRFFTFFGDGSLLFCGNIGETIPGKEAMREFEVVAGTGSISIYRVDTRTGSLIYTGKRIPVPAPSCILFRTV